MTDDKLLEITREVDDILSHLIEKYEIGALLVSSVLLARLMRMNVEIDNGVEFKNLMLKVIEKTKDQDTQKQVH
jgi:hypothetical protein